jgi:hypothetical protein
MRNLAVVGALSMLVLSGCSSDQPGLRLETFDVTLDGVGGQLPAYFSIPMCAEDGDHEVTIREVVATDKFGSGASFENFVDWPGGKDAEPSIGAAEFLPDAFEPAAGSTGTVPECGATEAADIAVVFPSVVTEEPIGVERMSVTYEVDGETATIVGDPLFVQCPVNEVGTDGSCRERSGG